MKVQGRHWAQERTHPLAECRVPFLTVILCGLAHRPWVWRLGPLPQPQAAGQGSSQEYSLFIPWPNFPLESEKAPTADVLSQTCTIRPSSLGPQTQGDQAKMGVGSWGQHSQWEGWKLSPRPRCPVASAACLRPQARRTQRRHSPCCLGLHGSPGTPGAHELGMKPLVRLCTLSAD